MFGRKKKPVVSPSSLGRSPYLYSAFHSSAQLASMVIQAALLTSTEPDLFGSLGIEVRVANPVEGDRWIAVTWRKAGRERGHLVVLGPSDGWEKVLENVFGQLEIDHDKANH
jgi:hypothetical protein